VSKLATTNTGVIDEFLFLTQIDRKIDRVCKVVDEIIENDRSSMPVLHFDRYKKTITTFLNANVMKQKMREILSIECKEGLRQAVDFFNYPQVLEMSRCEDDLNSPNAMMDMSQYFSTLQASPSIQLRKKLIEKADKLKCSSAIAVAMQVTLFKAITYGMRGLSEKNQELSEANMEKMTSDTANQMSTPIKQQVWMGMMFAYKSLSDIELKECIALLESNEGKWASEFLQSVYLKMYGQVVERVQNGLENEFPPLYLMGK